MIEHNARNDTEKRLNNKLRLGDEYEKRFKRKHLY